MINVLKVHYFNMKTTIKVYFILLSIVCWRWLTQSRKPIVHASFQLSVQWCHLEGTYSTTEVFTPQKLANTINQKFFLGR